MSHLRKLSGWMAAAAAFCLLCLLLARAISGNIQNAHAEPVRNLPSEAPDAAVAVAAFEAIVPTLRNPRCMNCHMTGDFPRQGDDSHPHIMDVRRGPDGHGVNGVKCSTCHQDHNLPGIHMPPGAPEWALPSPAMPMIWEGLTDRQLCQLLKDPNRNGHRTVGEIVVHMGTPLVLWGWHPGEGRTPIPQPQAEFEADVKEWADNGAACPK